MLWNGKPLPRKEARSREETEGLARDGAQRLTRAQKWPLTGEAECRGCKPMDGLPEQEEASTQPGTGR